MNVPMSARSSETDRQLKGPESFHLVFFFFLGSSLGRCVIGLDRSNFHEASEGSPVSVV